MGIRIRGKIWKVGNSHVMTVPRAIMAAGNLYEGQEVLAEVEGVPEALIKKQDTPSPVKRARATEEWETPYGNLTVTLTQHTISQDTTWEF